jgi:phosphate transport system substrate-binding protein
MRHSQSGDIALSWYACLNRPAVCARTLNRPEGGVRQVRSRTQGADRTNGLWLILFASALVVTSVVLLLFRDRIFRPSEQIVLSLYGSTSLGDELMPQLAAAFLRDEMGAEKTGVRVAGKDERGHPYLRVWGKIPGRSGLQVIEIYAAGSSTAFKCLATESGPASCDIGMASRPINDSDKTAFPALRNLGVRSNEHVVALDGIAIIVNPKNPVSELSIPQLRAIYTGQIDNWKDVGGLDAPIELYGRDRNSGTFEMFTEKVIGKDVSTGAGTIAVTPSHQIADSGLIVDSVMRSPNAIGYVSSPMIKDAKALPISDGSGPAFPPTQLAIVTEDYPICRRLLLYDWDAPGSLMNAFVRYVVYKPGQTLVTQTPFVELTPKVFTVSPPPNAPKGYKEMASEYSRIGLSFHFSSEQADAAADTNQLDNLARVNVLRLRTFLAQHGGTGDDILLIGFDDQYEGEIPKQNLAHKRAESVATSLRAIGVIVPSENVHDFGSNLPVATNETSEGRRKNRRVEVWVRDGLE